MEPEFEKNEVRRGSYPETVEAPGTAEASDFGDRGNGKSTLVMREQEGGKAMPVQHRRRDTHTISLENLLTFESNCQDVSELGLTQRLTGQ